MGSDKLVMKASKLDAPSNAIRPSGRSRACSAKIVLEDPTIDVAPTPEAIPSALGEVEDALADLLARRTVEESLKRK